MHLGELTWTDIDEPIVVVPVGSCEQHGPHLPLDTDTRIASTIANECALRRRDVLIAPTLSITASGEHAGFAGTLSIGTEAMTHVLIELVRSADWARGVVFVNGHGGNAAAMRRAREVLTEEHRQVLAWWPRLPDADPHAGHTETSLMLAIEPDLVRMDRCVAGPTPSMSELMAHGVRPLSASGVLGDPTAATHDHGRRMLAELVDQLDDAIDAAIDSWR